MVVKIQMPRRHYKYICMIVRAGKCPSEKNVLQEIFEKGLGEAEFDSTIGGVPDMDMSLLRGKQIIITMDIVKSEFDRKLEFIKKGYEYPEDRVMSIVFLQGLFEYYPLLKGSELYLTDEKFKEEVDRMPHDLCYDM